MASLKKIKYFFSSLHVVYFFCVLMGLLFTIGFVAREHSIYVWDLAGYHFTLKSWLQLFYDTPLSSFLDKLWMSIQNDEYNATALFLPAFPYAALGGGRVAFLSSILITYQFPLFFLLMYLSWKILGNGGKIPFSLGATLLVLFFFNPHIWLVTLRGYSDIGPLLFFSLAIFMALATKIEDRVLVGRMILLGLLLYCCCLFRRWYGFAMASFYISYFGSSLLYVRRNDLRRNLRSLLINAFLSGGTTLICYMIFQFNYIYSVATSNLGEQYSVYWYGWKDFIAAHYRSIGPLLAGILVAAPFIYRHTKSSCRILIFFFLFLSIYPVSMYLLSGTGDNHKLPFVLVSMLVATTVLIILQKSMVALLGKYCIFGVASLLSIALFVLQALPLPWWEMVGGVAPAGYLRPLWHPGYKELQRMYRYMEGLSDGTNDKIAVISGTGQFNHTLISHNSGDILPLHVMWREHFWDLRDGINTEFLGARYVAVTDPPQATEHQTIVRIPTELLLNEDGIGKAYKALDKTFDLGCGFIVKIYEKTRAFTKEELLDYINRFPQNRAAWNNPVKEDDLLLFAASEISP